MNVKRQGLALVLSAPSGAGKSTLIRRLVQEFLHFTFSLSTTTRAPRAGEIDGREYNFATRTEFEDLIRQGHFAEWAMVHGNYYGTPLQATQELLQAGQDVLFDIDVQGARQLRQSLEESVLVFILPPGREELIRRLQKRGTDDAQEISRRMTTAREELSAAPEFDYWVVNDCLEDAYDRLRSIYLAEGCRMARNREVLRRIQAGWEVS
ncbi:MAG: guanylate kinase [Desulfovermiculus sp.]|nr:guanylate kinase [Desulfovermiculus sp.]